MWTPGPREGSQSPRCRGDFTQGSEVPGPIACDIGAVAPRHPEGRQGGLLSVPRGIRRSSPVDRSLRLFGSPDQRVAVGQRPQRKNSQSAKGFGLSDGSDRSKFYCLMAGSSRHGKLCFSPIPCTSPSSVKVLRAFCEPCTVGLPMSYECPTWTDIV